MEIENILKNKRDGKELTEREIKFFIDNMIIGKIDDAVIGAFLMATFIRNLTMAETISLTKSMINSGKIMRFKHDIIDFQNDVFVDKHSTGGVGDKISIVLAPALAACGLKVPMISGRSLAFTGGTINKLESIKGLNIKLSERDMYNCLKNSGTFICETTKDFNLADKILYKKRNDTSTIDCMGLIVSSIISKKATEGIEHLILDIKVGKGAFCKTIESAKELADKMEFVSKAVRINTKAILTKMDYPLGRAVGNSLEIMECINLMRGKDVPHVKDIVIHFGGTLLEMAGKTDLSTGKNEIRNSLKNGTALETFYKMLISQGVEKGYANALCYEMELPIPIKSEFTTELKASSSGWIQEINSLTVAEVCHKLTHHNSMIEDLSTGVYIQRTVGEYVNKDETWITVHHFEAALDPSLQQLLDNSIIINDHNTCYQENGNDKLILTRI